MESNESTSQVSLLSPIGENLEIFSLIWLDLSDNEIHKNFDFQQQLRTIINYLKLFEHIDDCEQYVQSLSKDDRIVMLVHEKLAKEILERIHELRQIVSIYIYHTDDLQMMNEYKKIKSIKFDLEELFNQIKIDHIKRKKLEEPFIINIFNPNQSTDRLLTTFTSNTQFLHSQLLIHFLLHTKLTNEQILENKKELIELLKNEYHENQNQLKILHEFEHNYLPSNALWWYTLDSFLYQFLTKSLNTINIDLLYLLQFFIQDLVRELSQYQSAKSERVYRSYIVSNEEFQLMEQSIGKYLSINRFCTTFVNREHALDYFSDYDQNNNNNNMKKILLRIDANARSNKSKPFANITVQSQISDEDKVLFSLGSIFRIENIHRNKNDIYIVQLNFVSDDHSQLKSIFEHIKSQYGENETNLLSFGNALRRMGKLDEAEKCYQRVLQDPTYDQDLISRSYHHLGRIAEAKGDYDVSLEYLHQSLDIKIKTMKSTDPSIAQSYNSIGIVYQQKGDLEKALDAFNKALIIWKRTYGRNHPNVAGCYNNMGVVFKREKNYAEALECFQKALAIREKQPYVNHYDLAGSYNNIGAVYERLGHHDLAVESYNLSLKIKSKSLPAQHPSIASTLENLGYVYENRSAYLQALSYLEKAAVIYRQALPANHHDVLQIEQSIQRVSLKLQSNS